MTGYVKFGGKKEKKKRVKKLDGFDRGGKKKYGWVRIRMKRNENVEI